MFRLRPLRQLTSRLLLLSSQPRGYYFSDTRPILPTAVDVTSDEYKVCVCVCVQLILSAKLILRHV